jgi:hypothetical protein
MKSASQAPMKSLAVTAIATFLAACGADSAGSGTSPTATPASQLQAQVVASELVVAQNERVPIGILDHNTPVTDATVHVRAFILNGNTGTLKGESDAPFKGEGLEGAGTYVAHLTFDVAGDWGLDISASRPNGESARIQLPITITASPVVPAVGQAAPKSPSPVATTPDAASLIDSGNPPDDMHAVSIATAIAQHRPTLVVFASPAFCTSRICGPVVKVVQSLEPAYRDRLTFIHVEIYQNFKPDPSKRSLAQTVLDWRLQTEPWIFLIDPNGIIQSRFEGPTATDEVKAAIDQFLH